MALRRLAPLIAVACLSACALISGVGDLEIVATDAPEAGVDAVAAPPRDEAGPADAGPTCAAPSRCLAAPAGWEGPFAVVLAKQNKGDALACPPALTRDWERADLTDAAIPPAKCACGCGPVGGTCNVTLTEYTQSDVCVGNAITRPLTSACLKLGASTVSLKAASTAVATCPPDASTTIPPLDAGTSALGCSPTAPEGCATGVCMPTLPPTARLCVRPAGGTDGGPAAACPADYPDEITLSAGVEDTRGCTPCSCAANATCSFTYQTFTSDQCTTTPRVYSDTNCHFTLSRRNGGANVADASVAGSCTPSGSSPKGSVDVRPALTLCCAR